MVHVQKVAFFWYLMYITNNSISLTIIHHQRTKLRRLNNFILQTFLNCQKLYNTKIVNHRQFYIANISISQTNKRKKTWQSYIANNFISLTILYHWQLYKLVFTINKTCKNIYKKKIRKIERKKLSSFFSLRGWVTWPGNPPISWVWGGNLRNATDILNRPLLATFS